MDLRARLAALSGSVPPPPAPPPVQARVSVRERLRRLGVDGEAAFVDRDAPPVEDIAGAYQVGEGDARYLRIEQPIEAASEAFAEDWVRLWSERHVRALTSQTSLRCGDPTRALFIDTETTGLGGASTLVFLVGCVHWSEKGPKLTQFFLPGPGGERRMLDDLLDFLQRFDFLVTFNGRAFDVRALCDRFVLSGLHDGVAHLESMPHLDLLPPSRRVWRNALRDCRLVTIEREILRRSRGDDVSGEDIPMIYYRYLRTGRSPEIHDVIRHNAWDTVSLAVLGATLLRLLDDPVRGVAGRQAAETVDPEGQRRQAEQMVGLGALHMAHGQAEQAEEAIGHGLTHASPASRYVARKRLAALYKKHGELERALPIWHDMLDENVLAETHPYIEIAKVLEHRRRDPRAALEMVDRALREVCVDRPSRATERVLLERRRQRLMQALSKTSGSQAEVAASTSRRVPPSC